jgi:hypothetical protein
MVKRGRTLFLDWKEHEEINGDKLILDHATKYYRDLFRHSIQNDFDLDDLLWTEDEKVSRKYNLNLTLMSKK